MKIGLLNAFASDGTSDSERYDYWPMLRRYFSEHVSSALVLEEYNVTQRYWPNSLHDCDGWIIGASSNSVHDKNSWIMKLMEFACACHFNQKPLLGLGFGHQVIAYAMGGDVNKSLKGWGAGRRRTKIRQRKSWMVPDVADCSLGFCHRDQVDLLPDCATLLGGDSHCLHQIYAIGDHIFALQGHPEYDDPFIQARLEESKDGMGQSCYDAAVASLSRPVDSSLVGGWIWQFFCGRG